ncbi:hypothetical protein ACVXZ0_04350 [Staphylococcus aureus]
MDDEVVCRFRGSNTVMVRKKKWIIWMYRRKASCFSSDSMYSILTKTMTKNCALMGEHVRQAVPLMNREAPFVSETGWNTLQHVIWCSYYS